MTHEFAEHSAAEHAGQAWNREDIEVAEAPDCTDEAFNWLGICGQTGVLHVHALELIESRRRLLCTHR
jgi:hypothetical protein